MNVTAIGSAAAPAANASPEGGNALGGLDYNAFLKLLVAQLENQDPTKPMDSTEYLAQLASYANVEQSIRANAKLDQVISSLAAGQAAGVIGKTVTSADGSVSGKVTGYEIFADGARAVLESGAKVTLGPGVRVTDE